MKRSTRRSSIFQPPPVAVVEEKRIPASSFDTKFSLPSFTRKVEKLTDAQRAVISKTVFGNLLNIHYQMISKVLLNELIERWDSDNRTFMLPCGEVTITPRDVALILGLQVVGKPVVLDSPFSDMERDYGATPLNRNISISLLEERLEALGGLVNDDFIRTFVLCTLGVFLFPNSSGKVDSRFINLLEDLDNVHEYAWGEAVRQDLFSWIHKRKEENVRFVGGCLLLLQVWYYEHIDIGRPNLLGAEQFPRASRWESIRPSSFQRQSFNSKINKIEEDQITWVLHPTTSESEINVVKDFLEAESAKEEVPDSDLECVDSVACRLETLEIVPVKRPPNEDLKVHLRQDIFSDPPNTSSGIPVSCSETKEVLQSQSPAIHMGLELVSEASGASLDMPVVISKSPAIPSRTSKGKEFLQISPIKLATPIQTQDHGPECIGLQEQKLQELNKENAMLKEELAKLKAENKELKKENPVQEELVKLQEELVKLKAENEDLKQQRLEDQIGLGRILHEYFNP